jgi:hypothetical protein
MKHKEMPKGPLVKAEYEIEKDVADIIKAMEKHTKIPAATLVTTALKRFISAHKDYLPEDYGKATKAS